MKILKQNTLYFLAERKILKPKYFLWDKQRDEFITESNNKKHILSCWRQIMMLS